MMRVLRIASFLFGEPTCQRVFEPLVADWQRELEAAGTDTQRARVYLSGLAALLLTFARCMLEGGMVMPGGALTRGLLILTLSTIALLAAQMVSMTMAFSRHVPLEIRFWSTLPGVLAIAIPIASLPLMMVTRGPGRLSSRAAVAYVGAATLAAYLTASLTPLLRGDVRDELHEQIYQQSIADDRAGLITYPGTARRQARPTTPEERAAARERLRQNPLYQSAQAEQTRPRWGRGSLLAAGLTLALGGLGWALGGLGRTRAIHAAAWWALACLVLLFDGRFLFPGTRLSAIIPRVPYWMPLAIFTAAAIAALWVSTFKRERRQA